MKGFGDETYWWKRAEQAEERNRRLEGAIREYLEQRDSEDWTVEDQMLKEVLEATAPQPQEGESDG